MTQEKSQITGDSAESRDIGPNSEQDSPDEPESHPTKQSTKTESATLSDGSTRSNSTRTAFWSFLSGTPLVLSGSSILATNTSLPEALAYPPLVIGAFVWFGGIVTQLSSPPLPKTYENEELISTTTPTRRIAAAKNGTGLLFLVIGAWLLLDVSVPLAYPVVTLLVGSYLYAAGIFQFWVNSLTRYYLTSQRFMQVYQLLSVRSKSLPLNRVQSMEESRTLFERIFGIGHIALESAGDTGTSRITAKHIEDPHSVAEGIQSQLQH